MLNDDNVFGTICYNENKLAKIMRKEHESNQKSRIHIKKTVKSYDNKNY